MWNHACKIKKKKNDLRADQTPLSHQQQLEEAKADAAANEPNMKKRTKLEKVAHILANMHLIEKQRDNARIIKACSGKLRKGGLSMVIGPTPAGRTEFTKKKILRQQHFKKMLGVSIKQTALHFSRLHYTRRWDLLATPKRAKISSTVPFLHQLEPICMLRNYSIN